MEIYLEELERALQSGDVTVAMESARILAEEKSNIRLSVSDSTNLPEKRISVKIIIEDRYTSNVSILLDLFPSMKFADLKTLMFQRFEFPPQVQKWLVGKRLAKDTDTLRSCGVRPDNNVMFLYLVSARSIGLTKEAVYSHQPRRHTYSETCDGQEELQPLTLTARDSSPTLAPSVGWQCVGCTFINEPTRPGCLLCAMTRPDDYVLPANYELSDNERLRIEMEKHLEEEALNQRQINFQQLLAAEESSLILNSAEFDCPICFDHKGPRDGVILRDCLHVFCRDCLLSQVRYAESSVVFCPYNDGIVQCPSTLQEREIKALVTPEMYQKHLSFSLIEAESRSANSFHCQVPNCTGWCIYEDDVNTFNCPVCGAENCLTCKAVHSAISCRQYQNDVKIRAKNDIAAKRTQNKIEAMLKKGDAMKCPTCDIIVMKKDGCDWIRCTMCKTEICWVTKGPRWGPKGSGDTSGGCKCGVNGKSCHTNCQNCH